MTVRKILEKSAEYISIFCLIVGMTVGCQIGDNQVNVNSNNGDGNGSGGNGGNSGNGGHQSGVDFTDYIGGNYSIMVRNETSKSLVAFKGSPRAANLISGIPASATNHGLKLDANLFSNSCDFSLFIVTEEDYVANKTNLAALDNKPFTRLYAYYNKNASNNNMVYTISSKLGGECSITLNNTTQYNVELRRNGVYGETIGYAGQGTINTTFSVAADPEGYYLFPVFRRFDNASGEIITAFPKYTSGASAGKTIVKILNLNSSNPSAELFADQWISGVKFSPSAAYLRIYNGATNAVSLYSGTNSTALLTSTGGKLINSGESMLFEVKMQDLGNQTYSEFVTINQYRIGNAVNSGVYITTGTSEAGAEFDFYAGKMYTVNVGGDDLTYTVDTKWMDTSADVQF